MQLTFMGANRQVTGSRYCLQVNDVRVMIDCGLVQERPFLHRNWEVCPVAADSIHALLLTHVHIDHSGLIPRFVREGFRGKIYATQPTADLAEIVLRDSAHIQKEDAAYKKRRHRKEHRVGEHPEIPLYTPEDVEAALPLIQAMDYGKPARIADGIEVTFHDAGHILGSAMLEVNVDENGTRQRILFSGDIGQWGKPLIRDPSTFAQADFVIMESTYGDRNHDSSGDVATELGKMINETYRRGGNLVIPTFAIERAQELMYYVSRLVYEEKIPKVPIYLDSPMAVDVTDIFRRHREILDAETRHLIMSDEPPLRFPGLRMIQSAEDSKTINDSGKCIIMSPAGMCNAGRIKHHLRNNIGRPQSTILFVGYQAHGTLGRQILEGNSEVRIHGKMRQVKAHIAKINGLSGHADRSGLLRWIGSLQTAPRRVFLTHGEEEVSLQLATEIQETFKWPVTVPKYGDIVELG